MKKKISKLFRLTSLTWPLLFFSVFIVNAFVDTTPSESSSFLLNSKAAPTATITVTNTELCLGEQTTITFEGVDGNPNYSFTYTVNDGTEQTITTVNNEVSVILNSGITASGTYTYSLIGVVDSSDGGSINEINDQEVTITVTDPPAVDFDFTNDNACSGETIQFTSNATGNGTLSYIWNFGDGTTSTDENPVKIYNIVGNDSQVFSISLIVSDTNGCYTTIIKDIQVLRIPDISFFSDLPLKKCNAATGLFDVEFYNSSDSHSEIISYTIDWGDDSSDTFNNTDFIPYSTLISHSFEIGVYTVVFSATNSNGCVNEVEYEVIYGKAY